MLGGVLAVIAPSMGPIVGGLITENFSWHWLFLINVVPGLITVVLALSCLPREPMQLKLLRNLDVTSLLFIAVSLAALEIGLKEAPDRAGSRPSRWRCSEPSRPSCGSPCSGPQPAVDFSLFRERYLAYGCG